MWTAGTVLSGVTRPGRAPGRAGRQALDPAGSVQGRRGAFRVPPSADPGAGLWPRPWSRAPVHLKSAWTGSVAAELRPAWTGSVAAESLPGDLVSRVVHDPPTRLLEA